MPEARCPKCGKLYFGWSLRDHPQDCDCGAKLEIQSDNPPQVRAIATHYPFNSEWKLSIICPYCGEEHNHGGGDGQYPNYGYRTAHCTGTRTELLVYELVQGDIVI